MAYGLNLFRLIGLMEPACAGKSRVGVGVQILQANNLITNFFNLFDCVIQVISKSFQYLCHAADKLGGRQVCGT